VNNAGAEVIELKLTEISTIKELKKWFYGKSST